MVLAAQEPRESADANRTTDTEHADDRTDDHCDQPAHQDRHNRSGIIEVEPFLDREVAGDQRPDSADNTADARDNAQHLGRIGETDDAEHLAERGLTLEQLCAHQVGHAGPDSPVDEGNDEGYDDR